MFRNPQRDNNRHYKTQRYCKGQPRYIIILTARLPACVTTYNSLHSWGPWGGRSGAADITNAFIALTYVSTAPHPPIMVSVCLKDTHYWRCLSMVCMWMGERAAMCPMLYRHGDEWVPRWSCAKLQAETRKLIPFSVSRDAAIRHEWRENPPWTIQVKRRQVNAPSLPLQGETL